jgi:Protein of unknown function (DUF5672)
MIQAAQLPQVTLIAISSVAVTATLSALRRSLDHVQFGRALLLTDREPDGLAGTGIEWRAIAPLRSRTDYSRFVLHGLADHIETSHALLVQWDGFVRDGRCWRDEFLGYDYIGAPWPQHGMMVGNGGFSLRSRRLLQATATLPLTDHPEDVAISRIHRQLLEQQHGLRFAELDVARRFSYERSRSDRLEFGFHGVFNLPAELQAEAMMAVLSSLEPGVIGERESSEMLTKAVRAGDWPLALLALRHHRAHPRHGRRLLRGRDGAPTAQMELP